MKDFKNDSPSVLIEKLKEQNSGGFLIDSFLFKHSEVEGRKSNQANDRLMSFNLLFNCTYQKDYLFNVLLEFEQVSLIDFIEKLKVRLSVMVRNKIIQRLIDANGLNLSVDEFKKLDSDKIRTTIAQGKNNFLDKEVVKISFVDFLNKKPRASIKRRDIKNKYERLINLCVSVCKLRDQGLDESVTKQVFAHENADFISDCYHKTRTVDSLNSLLTEELNSIQ